MSALSTQPPVASASPLTAEAAQQQLTKHLRQTASYIRIFDILIVVIGWFVALLGFWLTACLIDHWLLPLPSLFRWSVWSCAMAGTLWLALVRLVPLLWRRINPVYAAQQIEHLIPEFKNGLISWLQLQSLPDSGVPKGVMAALSYRAVRFLGGQEPSSTVDTGPLIKLVGTSLLLTITIAVYAMLSPKSLLDTGKRLAFPWLNIAAPTRTQILEVNPGDVQLTQGTPLQVEVQLRGLRSKDDVLLRYDSLDGQFTNQRIELKPQVEGLQYAGQVSTGTHGIDQDLRYWIEAGDAVSGPYRVTLNPLPSVALQRVRIEYPAYTRLEPEDIAAGVNIEALEGSQLHIWATSNQQLDRAMLAINPELDSPGHVVRAGEYLDMRVDQLNLSGSCKLALPQKSFCLRGYNARGDSNSHPLVRPLKVFSDVPPEIQLVGPESRTVRVAPDSRLNLEIRATDPDFGLSKVLVQLRVNQGSLFSKTLLEESDQQSAAVLSRVLSLPVNVGSLKAAPGDRIQIVAIAMDNRHDPIKQELSPNQQKSLPLILEVVAPEQSNVPPEMKRQWSSTPKEHDDPAKNNQQQPDPGNQQNSEASLPGSRSQESDQQPADSSEQSQRDSSDNNQSGNNQSGNNQSGNNQSGNNQSGNNQSGGNQSGSDQSGSDQSSGKQSNGGNSSASQSTTNKTGDKQTEGRQNGGGQSGDNQSGDNQSGDNQSGDNQSGDNQSGDNQSGDNQSGDNQSGDNQSGDSQAGDRASKSGSERSKSNQDAQSDNRNTQGGNSRSNDAQPGDTRGDSESSASSQQRDRESLKRVKEYLDKQQANSDQQLGADSESNQKPSQTSNQNAGAGKSAGKSEPQDSAGAGSKSAADSRSSDQRKKNTNSGESQSGGEQKDGKQKDGKQKEGEQKDGKQSGGNQSNSSPDQSGSPQSSSAQNSGQQSAQQQSDAQQSGEQQNSKQQDTASQGAEQESAGQEGAGQENSDKQSDQQSNDSQKDSSQSQSSQSQSSQSQSGQSQSGQSQSGQSQSGESQSIETQSGQSKSGQPATPKSGSQTKNSPSKSSPQSNGSPQSNSAGQQSNSGQPASGGQPGQGAQQNSTSNSRKNAQPNGAPSTGPGSGSSNSTAGSGPGDASSTDDPATFDPSLSEQATDLTLDYLKRQREQPDPELLKELDWTQQDLDEFLNRYKSAKDLTSLAKPLETQSSSEMQNLELKSPSSSAIGPSGQGDDFRQQLDGGGRIRPPERLRKQIEEFQKALRQQRH